MSAPFRGRRRCRRDRRRRTGRCGGQDIHAALARLDPPRKHYHWYYSTREANANMRGTAAGRAWLPARLFPPQERRLAGQQALPPGGLDRRGTRQDADLLHHAARPGHGGDGGAAHALARRRSRPAAGCRSAELAVYAAEYERNGFQGGLQWYRVRTTGRFEAEAQVFAGRSDRGALGVHRRRAATGACTRRRARWSGCATAPARG